MGSSIEDSTTPVTSRLLDRCVVEALSSLPERTRFMKGLYCLGRIPCARNRFEPRPARAADAAVRNPGAAIAGGIRTHAFSNLPLRLGSALGAFLALIGNRIRHRVVIEHFVQGHDVPGWATIVAGLMSSAGFNC